MNIKGLFANILPTTTVTGASKTQKAIRADTAADRDANGQQAGGQQQESREPMTEEQIEAAMAHLRSLPGVKDHQWQVELSIVEDKKFVLIKDSSGTVIRRIPELELWSLKPEAQPGKGQLLKRTA
ncbi:MAG: hypothetical protein EOP06_09560 [Proteobacteria bacterium]|nr:MAG: hypothetical protein EOP06_09560 [Pseudomonadota bacterium]